MSKLPSLKSVQVFEAAARHLSFSLAAKELYVTQSAVSHQIKSLESHLGKSLFTRANNSVVLTQYGDIYFSVIRDSFSRIQTVTDHLMDNKEIKLRIVAQSSFAVSWLASRISSFKNEHPNIELTLSMATSAEHYEPSEYDISIGTWPTPENYKSQLIRQERWYPVLTTKLSGQINNQDPYSILALPLWSSENGQDWKLWMQEQKLDPSINLDIMHLSHTLLAGRAALDGLRVALSCDFIVSDDIERGDLIAVKELSYSPSWGNYYIHYHAGSHYINKIEKFITWLMKLCNK
ncbi:LysR family transcriptional regulator [Cognaticolwellia mytili]|uniref:LysR family transcriptional regulator n=1 Tax=Cognaticolwellia mytili TaxID=1888913 RepID=UPI000A173C1C|nr:LysR family transcriptional regulator [Cognaticolwellia mytili]